MLEPHTVHVLGAGVMGSGVAQTLAQTGHRVVLLDVADEALERARERIQQGLRLEILLQKKAEKQDPAVVLDRIRFTIDMEALREAAYVIENVPEKWDIKKKVYADLEAACPEACIFASDTSCMPIGRIATWTERPGQVIGIHFMNPVPRKRVVEVIRGAATTEETIARTGTLLQQMGKECVIVNDAPGFVSNRVLMLTINEAAFVLQEGTGSAKEIDRIFRDCMGHAMGPLETADLIGLDTILYSIEVLYDSLGGEKFRPCPLLEDLVREGHLGCKTGRGFHDYPDAVLGT